MTQLYARVFTQILDSSLAENWQARHVFEDLLKLADEGIVDMTRQAISRRTNVPLEIVNEAIAVLESPDPDSRDAADEGRRLVRLDEHRDWGWIVVNWQKYEAIKSTLDQRTQARERKRRQRERTHHGNLPPVPPSKTASASEAEAPGHFVTCHDESRLKRDKGAKESRPASDLSDSDWLDSLKADPAYQGLDVPREHARMLRWCQENRKQPTRRRFVNWLNRVDRPLQTANQTARPDHTKGF